MTLFSSAEFSPCRTWRYSLWRSWGGNGKVLNVIGLNPSTADEVYDDPTIRRCIGFAKRLGCDSLAMTNLFAYRATDPKDMKAASDPVGPDNNDRIAGIALRAEIVVAAWGVHGAYLGRDKRVVDLLDRTACIHCWGRTKGGHPKHPLYLPGNSELSVFANPGAMVDRRK